MIRGPRVSLLLVTLLVILGLAAAPAHAGSVSMAWDQVTDPDLAGYRVFYGPAAGNYDQQIDVGLVTDHTVNGLTDCTTWFVAVKALDDAGNVSAGFSNEVSGWPRPTVATASPAVAEQGLQLDVAIDGTNFQGGASVLFDVPGITVNSVTVNGCGQVVANITVGGSTAPGVTGVNVINVDQTFGAGAGLFTVEAAVAPTVQATSPADGASGIGVAVQPFLTFSEALDPASVNSTTVQLLDAGGSPVSLGAGSPSLPGDGLTVTLVPASSLQLGGTYRLRAVGGAGGVQDLAGNPLASTFTQSTGFSTEADSIPPVVNSVGSSGVTATASSINWTTDEPSDGQVFYRVQGGSAYQQTAVDPGLVTDHSVLLQGLAANTSYEYHVRSVDSSGNATVSNPDATFSTQASSSTFLSFEAESGFLTAPMRAVNGSDAFGGAWTDTPAGTSQGTSNNPAGTAEFGVNVPSDGTWYLWVRILNPNGTGGTLYESVDGGSRVLMDVTSAGTWEWAAGRSYTLTAGQHTIELGGRKAESRADRILLTDDAGFVPTEQPVDDVTPTAPASGFSVAASDGVNVLNWTNPSDSDLDRVVVRVRTDGAYPTSPLDGIGVADQAASAGAGDTTTHSGLTNGTTYRYSVFIIDSSGNVSVAAQAEGIPVDNVPPSEVLNLRRTDLYTGP